MPARTAEAAKYVEDNDSTVAIEDDEEFPTGSSSNEARLVDTAKLYRVPLVPVDASFGLIEPKTKKALALQPAVRKEQKREHSDVLVLFAVRNVGCCGCREHAQQVLELADIPNVSVAAVVKETGVDDETLLTFHQDFFGRKTMYKDEKWMVFKSMGGGKLGVGALLMGIVGLKKRASKKKIAAGRMKGDFWTKGGVLVFNKKGRVVFTLREKFGAEFDMKAIREAIEKARAEH